jgi:hypothetical protein
MNDLMLNMLANQNFNISDFKEIGLSANNTKLETEDTYKQSKMIQENDLFKNDDGNFDDNKFHQYYLFATDQYNKLADETYIEDITKNTLYDKNNIYAPETSPRYDDVPKMVTIQNPFLQTHSMQRIGKKGDRELSISEIA